MTPSFLENVLRGAEALAARDPVGLLSDAELLKRFTSDRDPSAFAVLVRRHGPLVWGVCRNLLLEDGEAEDAFQATFLALVKSATSVNRPEALGGWLHGVAYRVAMKARRSAARRKKREANAANSEENIPVADGAWDEMQAAVHEEVCRLPEKLQLPFVLVGLQGRPQKEAAKQLGWTVGTFSARLCQARQQLLDRLAKRNIPVGMAASATALGVVSGSAAVPTALVMKALNVVAAPDAVTPFVISLSRGVTQMYLTRTKMLVAAVLLAGILTTGVGARLMSNAEAQTPETVAELERKLEALRDQQAKGKWEYKFVPMDKILPANELQRVLASHDREGWEYCGSQEIATRGQPVAHLTFKRPNKAFTPATEREQLLLEALRTYEEALRLDSKNKGAKKTSAEELKEYYQQALKAQADAASKLKSVEAQKAEVEARQRAELELKRALDAETRARLQAAEAEAAKSATLDERDRAAQLQKQLEALRAEHEALLKVVGPRKKAGSNEKAPPAEEKKLSIETSVIPLRNVSAQEASAILHKMLPLSKDVVSAEAQTNSLVLRGLPEMIAEIKQIIAKNIDVPSVMPPVLKVESSTTPNMKPTMAMLNLQQVKMTQKEVIEILAKAVPKIEIVPNPRNDMLTIKGTATDVETATAVIAKLAEAKAGESTTVSVNLKHLSLEQVATGLFKAMPASKVKLSIDAKSAVTLSGPAEDVAKAKKIVEELDAAAKPSY